MATHMEKDFEQLLNEINPLANIAGHEYEAGYALRLVDPVLFKEMYFEWIDQDSIPEGYEGVDFDTLPEGVEDIERVPYESVKHLILAERTEWDYVNLVATDPNGKVLVIHTVDSSNLDEYEFDEQSGLYHSPFGEEMCAGCVDYTVYEYDPLTHSWEEVDSALYEYYPGDTLEDFFKRNQVF